MRAVAFGAAAVAAPAAALTLAAGDARTSAGLTAAPFAWPRLLVAHLLTALPLGFVLAGYVRRHADGPATVWWVVAGAGAAGLFAALSPAVGGLLEVFEFGPVVSLLLRAATAVALVFPWCVAGLDAGPPAGPGGRLALVFAVAAAVVPAGLYSERLAEARAVAAAELIEGGRLARAEGVVIGLCEVGSDRRVRKASAAAVRREVAKELDGLRSAADSALPPTAPAASRLNRALILIQLDRLGEAAELLRPLAPSDLTALQLLAATARDLGLWAESDAAHAEVLARLLPRADREPPARRGCVLAFEGMAYNAGMDGRPKERGRVLLRGLEAVPGEAAHFHFLLGRHYADAGLPRPALEHLGEAVRLDPVRFRDRAAEAARHLRTSTYGCVLRGPSAGGAGSVPPAGQPASR